MSCIIKPIFDAGLELFFLVQEVQEEAREYEIKRERDDKKYSNIALNTLADLSDRLQAASQISNSSSKIKELALKKMVNINNLSVENLKILESDTDSLPGLSADLIKNPAKGKIEIYQVILERYGTLGYQEGADRVERKIKLIKTAHVIQNLIFFTGIITLVGILTL